jgi:hypothetical protein
VVARTRRQGIRSALFIGTGGPPLPVCSLDEVDEVDPERLFGLSHLPLLTSALAFHLVTSTREIGALHSLLDSRANAAVGNIVGALAECSKPSADGS